MKPYCSYAVSTQLVPIVVVLALLTILLAACSSPFPPHKKVTGTIAHEQPITAPHHALRTIAMCGDVTSSYPYADFMSAKAKLADAIEAAATQLNQDGLTAYVTLIQSNSWDPAATIATIVVPALAGDPAPPALLPMPTQGPDPYAYANAVKATQAANAHTQDIYDQTLRANHAKLARVQQQVRAQTAQLREMKPAIDNIQTDVFGCIERQAARFQGLSGDKYLFVASDGENNTLEQDTGSLDLRGVHVRFIDFYCQNATACTNTYWHDLLMQAGAADVLFFDPAQSQDLPASSLLS